MITRNDPPSAPAAVPPPAPVYATGGAHGRVARMVVVLCFTITIVATSLIYWRWANVTEPTSYIIIEGDAACNGTIVVIRSSGQPDTTAMATLTKDNDYAAAIFLQPGSYTLTATLNGDRLAHGNLLLAHRRAKVITLRGPKSAAAIAPRAGVS